MCTHDIVVLVPKLNGNKRFDLLDTLVPDTYGCNGGISLTSYVCTTHSVTYHYGIYIKTKDEINCSGSYKDRGVSGKSPFDEK